MNTQVSERITQIKQYLTSLNDHITADDHYSILNTVNNFKKDVLKYDPQLHANEFLFDSLNTKNQKLQAQLRQLQDEKSSLQMKLSINRQNPNNMKELNVGIFISRLTVSLNDVRKLEYDQVKIRCNYQQILIHSLDGNKYKDYTFIVGYISNVEYNNCFSHLLYKTTQQTLHILIRFQNEKEMQRWVTQLKFGMLTEECKKKKDKLFQPKKEEITTTATISPQPNAVTHDLKYKSCTSHVPTLSFGNMKEGSPNESTISQRKEKPVQNSLVDKVQRNTERQLVNALSSQTNPPQTIARNSQKYAAVTATRRLEQNRPPNLVRIRKLSQIMDQSCPTSNIQYVKDEKSNSRKQSSQIQKPLKSPVFEDKMQFNLHFQDINQIEDKSQNSPQQAIPIFRPQDSKPVQSPQNYSRASHLKCVEQKKKQLLSQYNLTIPSDKPAFQFEVNKVNWDEIQEMDDENKSKSSNMFSNKQRRESFMTQSQANASKQSTTQRKDERQSQHITEKSEEQSPKQRKSTNIQTLSTIQNLQIPNRVKYDTVPGLKLHQIQTPEQKTNILRPTEDIPSFGNNFKQQSKDQESRAFNSLMSQSDSYVHSNSFSHQNHTQSEDNTLRAEQLKKGIILTKYSQNGFWPHQKIIYLSENQKDLCYRDLKDKKIKKIKIDKIKSIEYKRYDKGIIKHVAKIEDDRCLVIRAQIQDDKSKNFEFVSAHPEPLQRFAANLNMWIEYYKKS